MSLKDIAAAVHADEALSQFPSSQQGTMAVPFTLGSHVEDIPAPYVKWQPTTDKFDPYPNLQNLPAKFNFAHKALATRVIGVDLYIHGELSPQDGTDDYASTEALLNAVVYALMRQGGTNVASIEGGRWFEDEENQLGSDRKVYVLSVTFATPVLEPSASYSLFVPTTESQLPVAGGVTFLDGDTVGPSTPSP